MMSNRQLRTSKILLRQRIKNDMMLRTCSNAVLHQCTGKRVKTLENQVAALDQINQKAIAGKLCKHDMKQVILFKKRLGTARFGGGNLLIVAGMQTLKLLLCQPSVLPD